MRHSIQARETVLPERVPQLSGEPSPAAGGSEDALAASLAILATSLGRPISTTALKAGLPGGGKLEPAVAPRALARAGLAGRVVARRLEALTGHALPCVLLLDEGEACVLLRAEADGFAIVTPDVPDGELVVPKRELADRYAGTAILARVQASPVAAPGNEDAHDAGKHWFWSVLLKQWPIYAEVLLAAFLVNCLALASPLFVMNVYDRVVPNNAIDTLWVLAIGVGIAFVFDFVLKLLRGYFVDSAGRVADMRLAARIFEQVLGLKMAQRPGSAGAFANQLREFETLRDFFASATVTTLVDLPFVFLFLAIVWFIGGPVAYVPLVAVPAVILVGLLMQIPLNNVVKRSFREAAQKHGVLVQAINGLETVKIAGAEGRVQSDWERCVAATAKSSNRSRLLSALTVNFAGFAANLVTVGVIALGVYQIAAGEMTVGALVACTIISGRAMAPLGQVAGLLTRFHQARTAYGTLNRLMRLEVERPAGRRFLHRPVLRGEVEFKSVTFAYPSQKFPALSDVSFKVAAGERVGLVGRVGSGKTTIDKLVMNLHEPERGAVLVDGTDVRQIDPADLRRNIGCVPQDVFLFSGSVRDNIAFGAPWADDEAVTAAARAAGAEAFVANHPEGFDMQVGERGEALSGGQRQAVAVARALLQRPAILLLDEPTSAMDNGAEARFKASLARELEGRTLLLITHRASLLGLVDRLIVLDGGKVVADGPREDVLKALAAGQIRGAA